jgi:two-component system NtrC family sensor kinase
LTEKRTTQIPKDTILIIDDSIELRSLLESILPYSGYQAVSATTGQEGLDLALQLEPDVILVDLELPDTSGLQVLEALSQQDHTVPTIMMTGYGSEGVAARALRLGALGYLVKPFTTEEVLAGVERALTVRRLYREKAQAATLLDTYGRHFRMIHAIGRAIITDTDLDQSYQRIVEAGLYATRAESCLLLLLENAQDQLCVAAACGEALHTDYCYSAQAGDERLRAVLDDNTCVRLDALPNASISLQTGDTALAVLQAPLNAGGRVVGLLSVDRKTTAGPFGKHEEGMLAIFADYAVLALEKHRQVEKTAAPTYPGPDEPNEQDSLDILDG